MSSIELQVADLKSGMVLTKPIVTRRGQTIAKSGTVLNHQLISKLSFYKITSATVDNSFDDPFGVEEEPKQAAIQPEIQPVVQPEIQPEIQLEAQPAIQPAEPLPEARDIAKPRPKADQSNTRVSDTVSYSQRIKSTQEYQTFQLDYTVNIAKLHQVFDQIVAGDTSINYDGILADVQSLFQSKTSLQLFGLIYTLHNIDDSVYAHSINVALIGRAIGKWLRYPKSKLDEITLAGLLHDVGKANIPAEVLNKTGSLTDEEFDLIRRHPLEGNKMLKKVHAPSTICTAALQHHERFDGTGYPRQLTGDEIDDIAAIIAIADVYDAMTASRSYRTPRCPFEVIHCFEQEGYQKYNPEIIMIFLKHIANLYLNAQVILSDGRKARVVFINRNFLSSPVVELSDKSTIDLSKDRSITIQKIL